MEPPVGFRGPFRTDAPARALYSEGAGIFRLVPRAVAVPEDLRDLTRLVRWAAAAGVALVPRGAGSGVTGGNVGSGIALDLTQGFRKPLVVDPDSRTARVGASVTYRELQDAALQHGLRLPPDPASGNFCTLAGMAATNAAGARSLKYGAMRRWVHTIEFVTADGEVGCTLAPAHRRTAAEQRFATDVAPAIRAQHRVLEASVPETSKNASGYGLLDFARSERETDILVGSEGTLVIITALEIALAPVPPAPATLLVTLRSLEQLSPAVLALAPLGPSACELLDRTYLDFARAAAHRPLPPDTEAVLLVEFEDGEPDAVEAVRDIAATTVFANEADELARLWELRHLASPILARLPEERRSLQLVEDGCVPVSALGRYVAALRDAATRHGFDIVIFGHAGDGHLHANVLADATRADLGTRLAACLEEVTAAQIALGGTPSGEHGDGRLRAGYLDRTFGRAYAELCRRVKAAWDPAAILNPGVKVAAPDAGAPAFDSLKVGPTAPEIPPDVAAHLRNMEREAGWGTFKLSLAPAPGAAH